MDRVVLMYFEDVLMQDVQGLVAASCPDTIPDDELKRALNVQLESIKSDVANIQHLMET